MGHRLSSTQQQGEAIDSTGDLLIYTGTGHGLSDGDYVYIESNLSSYNGFKYVDSIAYDSFKVRESENGPYVQFVQEADIQFYISVLDHGWQCVHLPIVYELESDISPNNTGEEEYNPNSVDSFENNAGYVQLNLDHALSDPTELSKIELVGGDMAGVYQIITVLQDWSVVIDLSYDAGYDFTGSVVVKYYDNYAINVNVYAGLPATHPWEDYKPYELAATLKLIPDSDNRVKFSIAAVLKGYIETRNKLDLDTLPNNLDFMTGFYISYFETYDVSDGEEITTFTGSVTTESTRGNAVNAMLEFKNINSGFLSDYISNGGVYKAAWLTHQDRPVAVVGLFFDLSFIHTQDSDVTVTIFKSYQGVVTDTEVIIIENPGIGVIRVPIIPESGYDQYCLEATIEGYEDPINFAIGFFNNPGPGDNWLLGATPQVAITITGTLSDIMYKDMDFVEGLEYTITTQMTDGGVLLGSFRVMILDDDFNILQSQATSLNASGAHTNTFQFTAPSNATKLGFRVVSALAGTATINSSLIAIESQSITEQICIDIIEECGSTLDSPLRITEGEDLRRLE